MRDWLGTLLGPASLCAAAAVLALVTLVTPPFAAAIEPAQEPTMLPITLHVVETAGVPVVDPAFVAARLARTNTIFAPYALQFQVVARQPIAAHHAAIEDREDRDVLGEYFTRGTLHVFCVASLRDIHEPERMRRGVHWHSRLHRGAHFVILSASSEPDVLAHEIGHYLGNPEHSDVPGNLMSYEHTDGVPFLDAAQLSRMRRKLRAYLARGELVPRRVVQAVTAP